MYTDKRGRVRFTSHGIRYEINKHGEVRAYLRYQQHPNSERSIPVKVHGLDLTGRMKLDDAVRTARYRMHQARTI